MARTQWSGWKSSGLPNRSVRALARRRLLAVLLSLLVLFPTALSASASAPPPLPQASTNKTFAAGSFIIDAGFMGSPALAYQPTTALQQYGLIYRLLVNEKIPVYWIIANDKTGVAGSAPSLTNTTADLTGVSVYSPYTSTTLTTKSYYSGPFVIPAEYLTDTRLGQILAAALPTALTGVRVDKAAAAFTAPVYDKVTYWPKATLDSQNGKIAQENFYANAKIPETAYSYNWKAPSQLNPCDDIFVMPHADPTWAVHYNLIPFNDRGGYIWAGCHASSVLENLDEPATVANPTEPATDINPDMNFLTTEGLLDFGDHDGGSIPYYYGSLLNVKPWTSATVPGTGTLPSEPADRSDPAMQVIGATESAHQNGSEQIYMPNPESLYPTLTGASSWNPGVRFLSWDPTQSNVLAKESPGVAAADVYGRGFDDPTNGLVMYQGGHNINNGVGATPAQRMFFNFLLLGGIERAPEVEIDRSILPATYASGGQVPITATIPATKGSPPFTYTWQSTCGGSFSQTSGTTAGGTVSTTWTAPGVNTPTSCQFRIVVTDSCDRQVFDSVGLTVLPVADLEITKTSTPTVAPTNSNITYTLNVRNLGPATSDGVIVTDTLPAGLEYVSATPAPSNVTGQVVTWNLGSLAMNATRTLTVTAKATQGGVTVQNKAVVSATTPDPNLTNNTAYANTQIINSGISITKVARPEIVPGTGGPVTFEFEVRNAGDNPLHDVVVTDNPGCTISGPTGDLNNDGLLNEKYLGVDREIWRFTCTRTVTSATPDRDVAFDGTFGKALDSLPNTKQDVVKVTAKDAANNDVSALAWTTVTVSTPAISVLKTLDPIGQTPGLGKDATFKVLVTNTGNVPLNTVDTTDIWAGTCDTAAIPNLPVGGKYEMLCTAKTPTTRFEASENFGTAKTYLDTGIGWAETSWDETVGDTNDDATKGSIQILDNKGNLPSALYFEPNNAQFSIERNVNLGSLGTGSAATLSFQCSRDKGFASGTGNANDALVILVGGVEVARVDAATDAALCPTDNGSTFATAGVWDIPAAALVSPVTVEIRATGDKKIYVDNLLITEKFVNKVTATAKGPFGEDAPPAIDYESVPTGNPPLSITKTASTAGPVVNGQEFTYTVTVTNTGTTFQTGVQVVDTLPPGLTLNGSVTAVKPIYANAFDGFGTARSYSEGSGWATAGWTETGETTNPTTDPPTDPTAGVVTVENNRGNPPSAVRFAATPSTTRSLSNQVNLAGMTSGTLSFNCSRESGNWTGSLEVLMNGTVIPDATVIGTTAVARCSQTGGQGEFGTVSVPIPTAALVAASTLEFRVIQGSGSGNTRAVFIDNVTVSAKNPAVPVTAGLPPTLTSAGGPYSIATGDTVTFTIPVKVTGGPADGFQFSNLAQATSTQQTNPVSASVITPYKLLPSFKMSKTAIETWVNTSGPVLYRIEVWNTGNKPLTMTSISDPSCNAPLAKIDTDPAKFGDINNDSLLQMGEIWRYTCTRTVSTPSSPPLPDDVPNTASATMTDGTTSVDDTASANVKVIHPAINIEVTPPSATVLINGHVDYTYTLTNTGDIDITNPAVTAANCTPVTYSSGDTDNDGILDVTETWKFTCATGALTTNQTNQAVTATGKDLIFASNVTSTKNVAVAVIDPKMAVVKTATDNKVGGATGDDIDVGYPNSVTYHYALTNTGNTPLSGITALDNKCSTVSADRLGADIIGDTDNNGKLDPTETWQYSCGPVHLEANTTNAVQFDATYTAGTLSGTVTATDTAHVDVLRPGLLLTKTASATRARLGGEITYTYLITNTGATSFLRTGFSDPVLHDDKCPDANMTFKNWLVDRAPTNSLDPPIPADPDNPASLPTPGDVIEYTCTTTMQPDMVVNNRVLNTVTTGAATDTIGNTYTPDPAQASVFILNPDFTVTKKATTALGGPDTAVDGEVGQPVAYTVTVAHSITTPTGGFLDDLNALSLNVVDPTCSAPVVARDADEDGFIDGDTDHDGVLDLNETWATTGTYFGDPDANALLNPGEIWTYGCRLAELPDGEPTLNTVTVTGTVDARSMTCTTDETPVCTPTEPNDGLAPIEKTAQATVTPLSKAVTLLKKAQHCDVGVPVCDLPGGEFMLYTSDPRLAGADPGVLLTNDPAGSAKFVSAKLLLNRDYWIVETKSPDGFQLLAQPIKFHLARTALTLDASTSSPFITADSANFTITVVDVPAADLPKAGGDGTMPYFGIGLLLIAGAGLYYWWASGPARAVRRAT